MLYTITAVLSYALINTVELLIVILLTQYLCAAHIDFSNKDLIIVGVINIVLQSSYSFLGIQVLYDNGQWLVLFIAIIIKSRRKLVDIFATIVGSFLYLVFSMLPYFLVTRSLRIESLQIAFLGSKISIIDIVTDILLLATLWLVRVKSNKYQFIVEFSIGEIFLGIFLGLIDFILLVALGYAEALSPVTGIIWIVLIDACYIALNFFYFYTVVKRRKNLYNEKQARIKQAFIDMQLSSLEQYKEREDDVIKMRHDFKKHMGIIEVLLSDNNDEQALEYIHELNESFKPRIRYITGCEVADAVVNTKCHQAKEMGVEFSYEGNLKEMSNMPGPDICGLLANAYDNALEACALCSVPYINTKVTDSKNYLTIVIKNSTSKKPSIKLNSIATTKKNKASHGYGISIMQQITKKYFGKFSISSTDNEFSLKIILLKSAINSPKKMAVNK